jgi:two-component sensor histidine kinase/DNA-binding response OmpR family regulator
MSEPVNILLVDDQPGKLLSYEVMLRELGETLIKTSCANEALEVLLKNDVAVILIDVCMPELDGFELAAMIREHPRFQKTALIFISAIHLSESDFVRGYDAGAVDYVPVPIVPELLRAKVRVFAELYRKTKQLESLNRELETRVAERTAALEAAHQRLKESEAARSLALASGSMGSWQYDMMDDTWTWDAGLRKIFAVGDEFQPSTDTIRSRIDASDMAQLTEAVKGLSPQNTTFQSEIRVMRDNGQVRWCLATIAAGLDAQGKAERLSGVLVDITDRKEAEAMQGLLAREVDHRARNALAVAQAIVRLARADSIEEYVKAVDGRIRALAHTHELLSKSRWQGADIERLVAEELAPYWEAGRNRISIEGPSIILSPEKAQAIGLVLHELATNAAKYGALSEVDGRLDVHWGVADNILTFHWIETGCRGITSPTHRGFGTKIITSSIRQGKEGKVEFEWPPGGLRFGMTIACGRETGLSGTAPARTEDRQTKSSTLPSKRALVVEDEALIGMLTMHMVKEMGYSIVGPMTNIADANAVIGKDDFDVAIIDLNLNGVPAYPLADALHTKGVPFVFVTGYAQDSIDRRFSHIPIVQKPIPREDLANAIARVVADKAIRAVQTTK